MYMQIYTYTHTYNCIINIISYINERFLNCERAPNRASCTCT